MRRREEPVEQPTQDELLEQCSREELISLIKKMLRREPDLEPLLLTMRKPQGAVTTQAYQRLVGNVFRGIDHMWGAAREIAEELEPIKETADTFVKQGANADAVTIYEVLIHALLDNIFDYEDALQEGSFHGPIRDCIEQLGICLESVTNDRELRERILKLLFDVYTFDVKAGGISLGEDAPTIMLEHTTTEERHVIARWLLKAIATNDGNDWSGKYRQQLYGGFLLQLEADTLDDEAYLGLCRETGRIGDAVERLLELGRVDEAVREAQQVDDYDLMALANIFVQHEHSAEAEALITERAATSSDTRLLDWLKKYYLSRNDKAKGLEIAVELFSKQPPALAYYQEIRLLAKMLNRWENLRPQLIAQLKKAKQTYLLIQIALDEKDVEEALVLLKAEQINVVGYGYSYSGSSLDIEVARAAEETFPRNAIEIYQNRIDRLINLRGRDSYHQAAQYLLRVRDLFSKLGESERWTTYITSLREKNRALRALKEEMQAVRLI
jgi:uncharacterized Zn finger protein